MTKTYNDIEAVTRLLEEVSTAFGMCCTSTVVEMDVPLFHSLSCDRSITSWETSSQQTAI